MKTGTSYSWRKEASRPYSDCSGPVNKPETRSNEPSGGRGKPGACAGLPAGNSGPA